MKMATKRVEYFRLNEIFNSKKNFFIERKKYKLKHKLVPSRDAYSIMTTNFKALKVV